MRPASDRLDRRVAPWAVAALAAALLLPRTSAAVPLSLVDGPVRVWADRELAASPREGYVQVRVSAENGDSTAHEVRVGYVARPWATVSQRVALQPRERRELDLLIPSFARFGQLHVDVDGVQNRVEGFSWNWSTAPPILADSARAAVQAGTTEPGDEDLGAPQPRTLALARDRLPRTLAGYIGFPAVVLVETAFDDLEEAQRRALEAYVATGGELYLSRVPGSPALFPASHEPVSRAGTYRYGFGKLHVFANAEACVAAVAGRPAIREVARPATPMATPERSGFGAPYAHRGRPYQAHAEPLLNVARVPAGGFLAIVLLFVAVIGPGSFVMRRRFGPQALLAFIPATALAACGGIAAYGAFHEGLFTIHASSQAITLLDSQGHRATTLSVNGYYASIAPRRVRFGPLEAVLLPERDSALAIEMGDGMSFTSGLVPSRSYREYLAYSVAPSRARLSVRRGPSGVTVENALGATIERGIVRIDGVSCEVPRLRDGAAGSATCGGEPRGLDGAELSLSRFESELVDAVALAPLEPDEFVVLLNRAVFAATGGLSLDRADDSQLVRGRIAP